MTSPWKIPGANEYTVWSTDGNGNYIANIIGMCRETNMRCNRSRPFHQDLNGDGTIGPTDDPDRDRVVWIDQPDRGWQQFLSL